MPDPITQAAEEYGRRAARRLHLRVDRDELDRSGILGQAKAELDVVLANNDADRATATLARNVMFATFANHLNELFLEGVPGGADEPVEAMP